MCDEMTDQEYMDTIKDRIPDYGPNMSMYTCPRCDRHEPISDDYRGTPLCRYCGVTLEFDKDADVYAQIHGFHVESDVESDC